MYSKNNEKWKKRKWMKRRRRRRYRKIGRIIEIDSTRFKSSR